jgi:serine/threonine-protein kinase
VLGAGTLTVADVINNRAVSLTSLKRYAEAEQAFRQAFDQHVALLGENHWRIRNIARNIGIVLGLQQRHEEALPWMDRALAIRRNATSAEDPALEYIRIQRAWMDFRLGRREEARAATVAAVAALEHMKDAGAAYWLAFSRVVLARMLTRTGQPVEAETAVRAALTWFERWGPANYKYAEAECELGQALVRRGAVADGRAKLERCLPIYRVWGQADSEVIASIERTLLSR